MEDNQSFLDLQIDEDAGTQLTETSRWARLLAIIVLSFTGILALSVMAAWSSLESLLGLADTGTAFDSREVTALKVMIGIMLAIFVVIAVILMTFLLKSAKALKAGVQKKDPVLVNTGLGHMRNYMAMMGILSIIFLVILLLAFFVN